MDIGLVVLVAEWFGGGSHTERRDYPSLTLWKTGFPTGQFPPAVADAVHSDEKNGRDCGRRDLDGFAEQAAAIARGREYK